MKIIWVRSRLQNPEILKGAPSISSYAGAFSINRGIVSIKAVKRDLQLADIGTASRGYPQLHQMGAVIHGEA
jgi:hypothetical protein